MAESGNTALLEAIKAQGQELSRRADWLQKMIERSSETILNCQKTIEGFRTSLEAANLTLNSLKYEYRKVLASSREGGTNGDPISKE